MNNSDESARRWLADISRNRSAADGAFVVGFSGHLGAGKTAFTKRIARELGIPETVTSPTFVIMKTYGVASADSAFERLVHIDAYRLERRADMEALNFEKASADPKNLIIVEWPENAGLKREDLDAWLQFEVRDGEYLIARK